MGAPIATAYVAAIESAVAHGCPKPLREVWSWEVPGDGGTWRLTFNGTAEEAELIPAYHLSVQWNGWPAGILGPAGGIIAAGAAANEQALIAALKQSPS